MDLSEFKSKLPGYVATGLCILVTSWWTTFMLQEMFFEGWYRAFDWLFFLLPGTACLALTLVAITWPRLGGWLLIVIGGGFNAAWLWRYQVTLGFGLTIPELLTMFAVSGLLVLVGGLFLLEGRRRRRASASPEPRWWRRNWRYLLAIGIPVLLGVAVSIEPARRLPGRVDDGYRGERLIEGHGVTLTWAPAGPGWGNVMPVPNWNQIALYGLPPVGFDDKERGRDGQCYRGSDVGCATADDLRRYNVCRYLSADGTRLMGEPQDYWRLPTTDELVRSLVRHGQNAGCTWNGKLGPQPCAVSPDKETPLWDPQRPILGYWSAEEYSRYNAYQVSYNGLVVWVQKIRGENFGYRCVRQGVASSIP